MGKQKGYTRPASLSVNDEIVKDADKLFRFSSQGFRSRAQDYGMTLQENYARLEQHIDGWLFLSASRVMAKKELGQRLLEMNSAREAASG